MEKKDRGTFWWMLLFFVACLFYRLIGLGDGLPLLLYPDEPHHLNIAAYFGSGDLNPHDFKYPGLWSYLLGMLYGVMYVVGWVFGYVRVPDDFAVSFFCNTTTIYWTVRFFSAVLISMVPSILFWIGRTYYSRTVGFAAASLFVLSPTMAEYGRDGTPYGVYLLLLVVCFAQFHRLVDLGDKKNYALTGFCIGLATGTLYLAAPLTVCMLLMHWKLRRPLSFLTVAGTAAFAAFFISNPFIFIDYRSFIGMFFGLFTTHTVAPLYTISMSGHLRNVAELLVTFLDPYGVGLVLSVLAFLKISKTQRTWFLAWLSPLFLLLPLLIASKFGAQYRYNFTVLFPALFLSAIGFDLLWHKTTGKVLWRGILLLGLGSFAIRDVAYVRERCLPDTRTQAKQWIVANIPLGQRVLITDPFYCPQLPMAPDQASRLRKKCEELHHPRAKYYEILEKCPGSGYELIYQRHSNAYVADVETRTIKSYQARDTIELTTATLGDLRTSGIDYVIIERGMTIRYGWQDILPATFPLVASFSAEKGVVKGPSLAIYQVR